MKIDMHIHSTFSDGSLSVEQIVTKASKNKVWYISLTDHDTIEGQELFIKYAKKYNIACVSGVEISTSYKNTHILGYNFKDIKTMDKELKDIARKNHLLCIQIIRRMQGDGYKISLEDAKKFIDSEYITLKCISKALVARNYALNQNDAFNKYFSYNKKYYYNFVKMDDIKAIDLIKFCGGIPVLAHPYYSCYDDVEEEIYNFINKGLMGLEVYYSLHKKKQIEQLANLAKKNKLISTAGSDFHKYNCNKVRDIGIKINYELFYEMGMDKIYRIGA